MADPATLDSLAASLGKVRTEAGSPSYAEIARRIGTVRGGTPPAKVTVYDCFRPGRRRVDADLVGEIVHALGRPEQEAQRWRARARLLNGERNGFYTEVRHGFRPVPATLVRQLTSIPADADVIVITGLPGVGKSTVASALSAGEEVLTVELRESELERAAADSVEILRRMVSAVNKTSSLPYDLARLRERLSEEGRGRTIVIEDAVSVPRLASLLVPGIRYIVTSRADLRGLRDQPGASLLRIAEVPLAPLEPSAGTDLLRALLGTERTQAASVKALERIVKVSGGLPLDLVVISGIVEKNPEWSLHDLASRFEQEPRDARVRSALEETVMLLDGRDLDLFSDIALIDRDFDEKVLLESRTSSASLDRLESTHLIRRSEGRVQLHATVFAFAQERTKQERPESLRRNRVAAFAHTVREFIDRDPHYAAREFGTVLALAGAAREYGLAAESAGLALAAHPSLEAWSMWSESLRLHDLAAQTAGVVVVPELSLGIARCAEKLGRYDEALLLLHRVRREAEGSALARTWNQIGSVERWMGHFDDALAAYEQSIALSMGNDVLVEGRARGNHADTLRIVARYAEAEQGYESSLALSRSVGDDLNIRIVRSNRTLLLISTGRFEDAETELHALRAELGEQAPPYLSFTLAQAAEARGEFPLAEKWIAEALTRVHDTNEHSTSAESRIFMARLHAHAGRQGQALSVAREVLREAQQSGTALIATDAMATLAEILLRGLTAEDPDPESLAEAEALTREAMATAEVTGDRTEIARALDILSSIAGLRGSATESAQLHRASEELHRSLGHVPLPRL